MQIEVDAAIQSFLERQRNKPVFVSIVSGKGGVGKSTVSVNLAVCLAEQGKRIGLIDADIYGFSIPSLMEIRQPPESSNEKMIPPEKLGVKIMSAGFLRLDNQPVIMRGPMLGRLINSFLKNVVWGELDYLIFDLPPGTGDIPLDLSQMLGNIKEIVVTTPNDTAAEVAFRAGAMTERTGNQILGIVENMSYMHCPSCENQIHIFGSNGGEKLARSLQSTLLVQIPLEPPSHDSPTRGVYTSESEPGKIYRQLASRVLELTGIQEA